MNILKRTAQKNFSSDYIMNNDHLDDSWEIISIYDYLDSLESCENVDYVKELLSIITRCFYTNNAKKNQYEVDKLLEDFCDL